MEAQARFDFVAESTSELPLTKGMLVNILDLSDPNWYKAEVNGTKGYVPKDYVELRPHDWFHGKISRLTAEQQLMQHGEPGTFLVRDSESDPGSFSISIRHAKGVQHFKVYCEKNGLYRLWEPGFRSLNALVDNYRTEPVSQHIPDLRLVQPLSHTPAEPAQLPVQSAPMRMRALFDFVPVEDEELGFKKDDIIEVISQEEENWWRGSCNGRTGLFPHTYCQLIN